MVETVGICDTENEHFFNGKFWHGYYVIESYSTCLFSDFMWLYQDLRCLIYKIPSFHHKSAQIPRDQRGLKTTKTLSVSLKEQNNQPSWTIAPNHQQPISESWWWCPHPPTTTPRTACCPGNSAASTSSSYVSGYGCPFPFLDGGIDHYSAHWVSNQGGTGAEQLGMAWTDTTYQTTWEKKPDETTHSF